MEGNYSLKDGLGSDRDAEGETDDEVDAQGETDDEVDAPGEIDDEMGAQGDSDDKVSAISNTNNGIDGTDRTGDDLFSTFTMDSKHPVGQVAHDLQADIERGEREEARRTKAATSSFEMFSKSTQKAINNMFTGTDAVWEEKARELQEQQAAAKSEWIKELEDHYKQTSRYNNCRRALKAAYKPAAAITLNKAREWQQIKQSVYRRSRESDHQKPNRRRKQRQINPMARRYAEEYAQLREHEAVEAECRGPPKRERRRRFDSAVDIFADQIISFEEEKETDKDVNAWIRAPGFLHERLVEQQEKERRTNENHHLVDGDPVYQRLSTAHLRPSRILRRDNLPTSAINPNPEGLRMAQDGDVPGFQVQPPSPPRLSSEYYRRQGRPRRSLARLDTDCLLSEDFVIAANEALDAFYGLQSDLADPLKQSFIYHYRHEFPDRKIEFPEKELRSWTLKLRLASKPTEGWVSKRGRPPYAEYGDDREAYSGISKDCERRGCRISCPRSRNTADTHRILANGRALQWSEKAIAERRSNVSRRRGSTLPPPLPSKHRTSKACRLVLKLHGKSWAKTPPTPPTPRLADLKSFGTPIDYTGDQRKENALVPFAEHDAKRPEQEIGWGQNRMLQSMSNSRLNFASTVRALSMQNMDSGNSKYTKVSQSRTSSFARRLPTPTPERDESTDTADKNYTNNKHPKKRKLHKKVEAWQHDPDAY